MSPEGERSFSPVTAVPEICLKEIGKRAARQAERQAMEQALYQTSWNRWKSAQILKISYKALLYKMQDCGLNFQPQGLEKLRPESELALPVTHA